MPLCLLFISQVDRKPLIIISDRVIFFEKKNILQRLKNQQRVEH
jgi:hypothetical protein